jgi:[CysO sulfur-carrier protein]-S-L-cysteine hydrolase
MRNIRNSSGYWEFDPLDLLKVFRDMDELGEEPVILYRVYSGTAYPSAMDVTYALPDVLHHVVLSVADAENVEFRSFHIDDGEITEEEVRVAPLSRRLQRARNRRRPGS